MDTVTSATPRKRVRLKDVAAAANLSVSGVSLALKEHPSINPKTIKKVREIAEKLGYHPDPVMSALIAHRKRSFVRQSSRVIAVISLAKTQDRWLELPGNRSIYDSAVMRAEQLGYKCEYFSTSREAGGLKRIRQILNSRGINSLIVVQNSDHNEAPDIVWDDCFVASIGRFNNSRGIAYCDRNWLEDLRFAWDSLCHLGGRKIAYLIESEDGLTNPILENNVFNYLPLLSRDHFIFVNKNLSPDEQCKHILRQVDTHGWDGFVGASGGFQHLVSRINKVHAQDLQYVSLDVSNENQPSSGIRPQYDLIGKAAIDLVHGRFLENKKGLDGLCVATLIDGISENQALSENPVACVA